MTEQVRITGGAGPFEAAAIVAVISLVLEIERVAQVSRPGSRLLPAWVRAGRPRDPDDPLGFILPDQRGDAV